MTREQLSQYIDNCILIGNVIETNSEIYKEILENEMIWVNLDALLGAVKIADGLYVKKDSNNQIHLVFYTREDEELDLGDCIDIIGRDVFTWNKTLKSIRGKSVVKIGNCAFSESVIESIDFPNLEELGSACFYYSGVKNVTLNKLKIISEDTFKGSKIESFRGDEVEVAEYGAFNYCTSLKKLILPKAEKIYSGGHNILEKVDIQVPKTCKFLRID